MTKGKDILLVEDLYTDAALNLHAFRRGNLRNRVIWVQTGEAAVECLAKRPGEWLLVLLDLKLPGMSGIDVLQHIRATESTKNMPVIVLTGSQAHADISASYNMGADGFITKPVTFIKFLELATSLGVALMLEPKESDGH